MTKHVKTTRIEKKYKDKKTGEEKKITIEHAKVIDRVLEFRKDNPRGVIESTPTIDGKMLIFKTHVVKDKSDRFSAESTGHAYAELDGTDKQFEKLETISVGRALALLGYAASGEVASFEEMEEYNNYRDAKIEEIVTKIHSCKTIDELRTYFMSLDSYIAESRVIEAKDIKKEELLNANSRAETE